MCSYIAMYVGRESIQHCIASLKHTVVLSYYTTSMNTKNNANSFEALLAHNADIISSYMCLNTYKLCGIIFGVC